MENKFLFFIFLSYLLCIPACEFLGIQNYNPSQSTTGNSRQSITGNNNQSTTDNNRQSTTGNNNQPVTGTNHQSTVDNSRQNSASCETNADCVLVNTNCCGCQAGGEAIAVHKSQKDSHDRRLKEQCAGEVSMLCPQWYRCKDFQAQCRNSQCVTINI